MTIVIKNVAIVGTSFHRGSTELLMRLKPMTPLALQRDPNNKYDSNAIAVGYGKRMLGYLPRNLVKDLAPLMDAGVEIKLVRAAMQGCVGTIRYDNGVNPDD